MEDNERIPYQRQSDKDLETVKSHLSEVVNNVSVIANNINWIKNCATFIGACLVVVLPFCVAYAVYLHNQVDAVSDRVTVLEGVRLRGTQDHRGCHYVALWPKKEPS